MPAIKRMHVERPLSVKLATLDRIDNGDKLKDIAADLGFTSTSTLSDWKRKAVQIRAMVNKGVSLKRRRDVAFKHPRVAESVVMWLRDLTGHQQATPLNHVMVMEKATL